MDDTATNENPAKGFNKLDLTQLQGFSFGTQWTQDKSAGRDGRRDDRPRREDDARRDGPVGDKRDRRGFRKPAGPGSDAPAAPAGGDAPRPAEGGDPRGDFRGGPRRDFRGGPRRDGPAGPGRPGEFRGGPRPGFRENGPMERDRAPYISPFFNVTFYPEDIGFSALAKAIRTSCRTYELFEIARVIIGKNDRFVAVIQRKTPESGPSGMTQQSGSDMSSGGAPAGAVRLAPLVISVPDGVPFETEDAAIAHVMSKHLGAYFDAAEIEIDPPKGNYQVVNKCGVTGELLGPPNYHRYNQIIQQHHANHVSRMAFESFRARIETIRDPEVINQWLEKMKKTTRYTWKLPHEGEAAPTFDALEEARMYLLAHARDKVVKLMDTGRFHGKSLDLLPPGEIRRAIESTLDRQRRFPLDTANALRGRLRREGFTIFKKGSKGVSYVCAVKRKFRVPGQTFSDSIGALISFIESNVMVKASELPAKLLGIHAPEAPATTAAPAGATTSPIPTSGSLPPMSTEPAAPATALSAEDHAKLARLNGDLRWLVAEGYVTEFIDGRLFAPPPMTEARKQEAEKDEHDPENFPDAPQTTPPLTAAATPAAAPEVAPEAETAGETPSEPVASVNADSAPVVDTTPEAPAESAAAPVEPVPEEVTPATEQDPETAKPA